MRQFFQAPADRAGGNAGRLYNRGNPAIAGRARLAGGEQSPPSFIQMPRYSSVAVADTGDIDHAGELHRRPVTAEAPNLTRERDPIQLFPDRPLRLVPGSEGGSRRNLVARVGPGEGPESTQ